MQTWLEKQEERNTRLKQMILDHPEADLSIWIMGHHGETHEGMLEKDIEYAGDTIYVTVS